ncbi:hypothetical protein IQ276_039470 [Desmonostoc muscorum LEGE 12446]|uniref:Uncharacterized protein n=1 Tax=Desmonostoc muscorum LEGE 12446 TaxID=1828758 RepID=A0A8J6ZJ10_DESMC|nr:hypothetical protein [Desmonostoc muscorum]MCF2152367.1 hypothetical protein [Desmonostoc muscorum LEGE 12446]
MATRIAKINANGRVHDDDSGDVFGTDEEEAYSFSKNVTLEQGGFSKSYEDSKTVDGEVRLTIKLDMQADGAGVITASGVVELWEGPSWNMGGSKGIDATNIMLGETKSVYDGRVDDSEGDWATVKLEIQNANGV